MTTFQLFVDAITLSSLYAHCTRSPIALICMLPQIVFFNERVLDLEVASSVLAKEASEREAHVEEALAAAEKLRGEQSCLQHELETLSARLAAEEAARQAAERTATDREEALQKEIQRAAVVLADARDPEVSVESVAAMPRAAAVGGSGGEVASSEVSGSLAAVDSSGQKEEQSSGEPTTTGTILESDTAGRAGAGQSSVSQLELEEQIVRLKDALEKAQKGAREGGMVLAGQLLGEEEPTVASALESSDVDGEGFVFMGHPPPLLCLLVTLLRASSFLSPHTPTHSAPRRYC